MAKKRYQRWTGYTIEDCDCRYCVYYGGKRDGEIRCLVDECVCKEELKSIARKEKAEKWK